MIRLKPICENDQYEDIEALYEFLLYKTLPFPLSAYLPKNEKGYYYYQDGERKDSKRKYPKMEDEEKKRKKVEKILCDFLKSQYKVAHPEFDDANGEKWAESVCKRICKKLYDIAPGDSETGLRKLLYAIPSEDEVEKTMKEFEHDLPKDEKFSENFHQFLNNELFQYKLFSSKKLFGKLVQMLGITVCPYCNRSFTTTAEKKDGTYHRQNQIDHYAPKSRYPWFALSLNNFVPSCGSCNHKKSDKEGFVLYPYQEGFEEHYRFRTIPRSGVGYLTGKPGSENEFEIYIEKNPDEEKSEKSKYDDRVRNTIEQLGLDVLYRDSHNAYVAGIYRQRHILGEPYVKSLMASFPGYFSSETDVRNLLYLKNIDVDEEPLSKLTRDIDDEITGITQE